MYEEMFKAYGKKIHLLTKLDNFSVGFPGLVTNTQTLSWKSYSSSYKK